MPARSRDDRIPRRIAIHEAAHAVAQCRFALGFRAVYVRSRADLDAGRVIEIAGRVHPAQGCCEGISGFAWHRCGRTRHLTSLPRHWWAAVRQRGIDAMTISLAGPYGEAKAMRRTRALIVRYGSGAEDWCKADAIARYLATDRSDHAHLHTLVHDRVRAFLAEDAAWQAINRLADRLIAARTVSGEQADPLLAHIQGDRPATWQHERDRSEL